MIDFFVNATVTVLFVCFYLAMGYWFLDLKTLPREHWVSRYANRVKGFFGAIWEPMRWKTRRLNVRLLLVIDNLVMRLTNLDLVLMSKKLGIAIKKLFLKFVALAAKIKKLFFEKNENKR
jgi:hypothetical protein